MNPAEVADALQHLIAGRARHMPFRWARAFMSPEAYQAVQGELLFAQHGLSPKPDPRLSGMEMRLEWKP